MRQNPASPPSSPWGAIGTLFLVACLIVLARNPLWQLDQVRLVPTISRSLLTPEKAWQVPILTAEGSELLVAVPYLIYAILAAALIALVAIQFGQQFNVLSLLVVVSLSGAISPLNLIPAAGLFGLRHVGIAAWFQSRRLLRVVCLLSILFVAMLSTLEFGVCLFFLLFALLSTQDSSVRQRVLLAGGLIAGTLLCRFLRPEFFDVALRPLSWSWLQVPHELLPSLQTPVILPEKWLSLGAMLAVAALLWRVRVGRNLDGGSLRKYGLLGGLFCFSLLGLGCAHYYFLSALAGLLLVLSMGTVQGTWPGWNRISSVAIGLAVIGLVWQTDKLAFVAGVVPVRRVDPSMWVQRGRVILMDLDESLAWQTGRLAHQFQLVLDDRWDLFGGLYSEYLGTCRDLKEVRIHSYLRSDGRWGGYKRVVNDWNASLLVVNSQQLGAIRGLSNSPDWKLMGIDGERTLFGSQKEPANLPQLQQALQAILFLEWPSRQQTIEIEETIVVGDDSDARNVANVLCAIRLPYAALRYIREDRSPQAEKVRTRCYLELAHRVYRHSGEGSLLDQYRAISRLRGEIQEGVWSERELVSIARALEGIGQTVVANEVLGKAAGGLADGLLQDLTERTGQDSLMQQLRLVLLEGREEAARELIAEIDPGRRPIFAVLLESPRLSTSEMFKRWDPLFAWGGQEQEFMNGELKFYMGCLAIEAGESTIAIDALQESKRLASGLPFGEIGQLYLQQLLR